MIILLYSTPIPDLFANEHRSRLIGKSTLVFRQTNRIRTPEVLSHQPQVRTTHGHQTAIAGRFRK